jgi:uncharacterized repeat protein (TIGR02543 family)
MAVTPAEGGTATDLTGASPYEVGTVVNIGAVASPGFGFVRWSAPAGTFGDATDPTTNFTMPGTPVTVTAHFVRVFALTTTHTPDIDFVAPVGPDAVFNVTPIETTFHPAGAVVGVRARPRPGWRFVNWTATAGDITDPNIALTTFIMPAQNVTLTANLATGFRVTMRTWPLSAGIAAEMVRFPPYAPNATIPIETFGFEGFTFTGWNWTLAGTYGNASAMSTNLTFPATINATHPPPPRIVQANFDFTGTWYVTVTMNATPAGAGNTTPTVGEILNVTPGTILTVTAAPNPGWLFANWTSHWPGPPVPAARWGVFVNATAPTTTFHVPSRNVTVTANFRPA